MKSCTSSEVVREVSFDNECWPEVSKAMANIVAAWAMLEFGMNNKDIISMLGMGEALIKSCYDKGRHGTFTSFLMNKVDPLFFRVLKKVYEKLNLVTR